MKITVIVTLAAMIAMATAPAAEQPVPAAPEIRAKQLADLKWGMFVCWSFSTFSGKEWTPGITDIDLFKPTGCDTDQWAKTAKEAGMGYILFLAKHHDGFCLWDTATTDRKVGKTKALPGRDILAELKESCDKYGIRLALYFSESEWIWPDFPDGRARRNGGGYNPDMKKAQLKELLTRYGPIEYIWFDYAVGDGGLSHAGTISYVKSLQPGCFVGFNNGDQEGADIRLGEEGRPGPLDDQAAAGKHMDRPAAKSYRLAEFTYPILPKNHEGGAMWFYSLPKHDNLCLPAENIYKDYLGAVKYGNIFSSDVGPDYSGRIRDIDLKTLRQVGQYIRGEIKPPAAPATSAAVPATRQLKWHELELYGMVNISTITYYGREWGYGDEEAAKFNPTEFDARQIVNAAKAGGLKALVIDAKHHGGFCLWPSKYTEYSVKNSPWKNGKGDMVGELLQACREQGLAVGIYLSPWDRNHKDYGKPAYITYYRKQLRELLTNYGPVSMVWFDGANGGDGYYGGAREHRNIDRKTYYDWDTTIELVRQLQPDACIFSDAGPDLRWVGNEQGVAGDPCWATVNADGWVPGISNTKMLNSGKRGGKSWIPAECDFPQRQGWFWHPGGSSKSPAALVNSYFHSVGRNAAMDLGIAPDRRGLICEEDAAALKGFGDRIRAIFADNLAARAKADDLALDFDKPTTFSVISLREDIRLGQRVDQWALDAWQDGAWQEFATGTGIGSRRLWRGEPITSSKIRLRVLKSSEPPVISEFAVYLEPEASRKEAGLGNRIETGVPRTTWKIVSASSEGEPAANAIDGKPATLWHSHTVAGCQPPPQEFVVDMGGQHTINGFLYLPRQDSSTTGNVDQYELQLSGDGKTWTTAAKGEFGNIKANPVQQKVLLGNPAKARFFKFIALHSADAGCVNVADFGVIGK